MDSYQNAYTIPSGEKLDSKQKEYITKLIYAIFSASKKDGEIDIDYQKMSQIFDIAINSIPKKDDKLLEYIKQSKTKNGFEPLMTEGFIEYDRYYSGRRTPSQMKFFMINNCLDKNGNFSLPRFRAFIFLSGIIGTDDYSVIDELKNNILDKDGEIVPDKYNFVFAMLGTLANIAAEEYPNETAKEIKIPLMGAKLIILEQLVEQIKDKNGDYDPKKAMEAFSDWCRYAYENRNITNNNIAINFIQQNKSTKTPLAEIIADDNLILEENPLGYNSTIYRLLCLLSNESVFEEWKN